MSTQDNWVTVCEKDDLIEDTGLCALLEGDAGQEEQVAIFLVGKTDKLYAICNYDPIGDANVLSRGIIGSVNGELVVASPLYKQHFNLETGVCIEDPDTILKVYQVRVEQNQVQLHV